MGKLPLLILVVGLSLYGLNKDHAWRPVLAVKHITSLDTATDVSRYFERFLPIFCVLIGCIFLYGVISYFQ